MSDTIFALSSGAPPSAISVMRLSGAGAGSALAALAGSLPEPRKAVVRTLRTDTGDVLDRALVLWFPGPASATGEDCAELHCHGGRAVVAAIGTELSAMTGMRQADPGEFTRRAFANGRIDLAQVEALGDLLAAETELQRRVAQAGVGGALSTVVDDWRARTLQLSASVEAELDFSDEDDVTSVRERFRLDRAELMHEISEVLARPPAERLRDGIRVVISGPPNSGKSSLFNALIGDGAAIVSPLAGTTRDVIERPVAFNGVPFVLVDTAGLRDEGTEEIERIGISLAHGQIESADIVLWLGPQGKGPDGAINVQSRCDEVGAREVPTYDHRVSSVTGEGMAGLENDLVARAKSLLPRPGSTAINRRQHELLEEAKQGLGMASGDLLLLGEGLRTARVAFDRLLGRSGVEEMLDVLFGRFCIGK